MATLVNRLAPVVYCLLPTAYCLLPTAYCLLPTAYCLLPTACLSSLRLRLLPTSACRRAAELLGLVERRSYVVRQHAAGKLDGNGRRVAFVDGQQACLDAELVILLGADTCLEVARQRCDEPVRHQNAEERADQRRADVMADFSGGLVDVSHRNDDAENRRHDAEAR